MAVPRLLNPGHGRGGHRATFRFYEELNDFLPPPWCKQDITYRFRDTPAIRDPIEALGVPPTEVELVMVNGESAGFDYRLRDGDRVAVYPVFEALDVTPLLRLRPRPLRRLRFVAGANLGTLARELRSLGFDTLDRSDCPDVEIARISTSEHRIVLTRDRRLLHARRISHGYQVRSGDPGGQLLEVIRRFDLEGAIRP